MELRAWILDDHRNVLNRLRGQIFDRVPAERLAETSGSEQDPDAGASMAWLLWHTLQHQDVAINAICRGIDPVLARDGWADRLGASGFSPGTGLSESGDVAASAALDSTALIPYAEAVWAETDAWLAAVDLTELEHTPDAHGALARLGVDAEGYSWLYRMWSDKPVSFHVMWEAIGHGYTHVGELVHLRNRMGLGGF